MVKHLVIPDAHVKPGVSNDRFDWLAKYAVEKKPDVIVCIGDLADMSSLSSYDVGKKSFEGRRYKEDIAAVIDAQDRFFGPVRQEIERVRRNRKKRWEPRFVLTLGNHEDRISRAVNDDPKLEGTLGLDNLRYEEFGWEVIPYKEPIKIDGVNYCHFFTSGVMDRPIAGPNAARQTLMKKHESCISGHTHLIDMSVDTKPDGTRLWSIVAGCFFEHEEVYVSKQSNHAWWRGLVMLHEVDDGDFAHCLVTMDYLKDHYGD